MKARREKKIAAVLLVFFFFFFREMGDASECRSQSEATTTVTSH